MFLIILTIFFSCGILIDASISKTRTPTFSVKKYTHYESLHMVDNAKSYSTPVKVPKIIIAGAPAAGKGTQCEIIKRDLGVIHLSTGDILRAAVTEKSELGLKAKEYMDAGKLVPDELIINVVLERLKQNDCQTKGWLLDGFPRTKSQAEALTKAGVVPDCFILLDVPEELLVERVIGRRTDPITGKIYHLKFNPPESDEIRERLIHRSDDTEEKIKTRYRDFKHNIDSVQMNYVEKMVVINGGVSQGDVTKQIFNSLVRVLDDSSMPKSYLD